MKKIISILCFSILAFAISIPTASALTAEDVRMLIQLGFIPPNKVEVAYRLADALTRAESQRSGAQSGSQNTGAPSSGGQNLNDFYSSLSSDSRVSGSGSYVAGQTSTRRTSYDRGNDLNDFYEDLLYDSDYDNSYIFGSGGSNTNSSGTSLNDFYRQLAGSSSSNNSASSSSTSKPRLITLNSPSNTNIREGEEKTVLSFDLQNTSKDIYLSRLGVFFDGPTGWKPADNIESMSLRDSYGSVIWKTLGTLEWGTSTDSTKYSLAIASSSKPVVKANDRDTFSVSVKIKSDVGHNNDLSIQTYIPDNGLRVRQVSDDTKIYDIGESDEIRRFTIDN